MVDSGSALASEADATDCRRIREVIASYALACDARDEAAFLTIFHPDARAVYDGGDELAGAQNIGSWIMSATDHVRWQQHAIWPMKIDVVGDAATAIAYLTSHQVSHDEPTVAVMMNSRYDLELARSGDAWNITKLVLVVGTVEQRSVELGHLIPAKESHV